MKVRIFSPESSIIQYDTIFPLEGLDEKYYKDYLKNNPDLTIFKSKDFTNTISDAINDYDWFDLYELIDNLFDYTTIGEFDWRDTTGDYYELFQKHCSNLQCHLMYDSGEIILKLCCDFPDRNYIDIENNTLHFNFLNFAADMGEPIGTEVFFRIVERFMHNNNWHIGFWDENNELITNIIEWSFTNSLNIDKIKPVVWFGLKDTITKCWSITNETPDSFIEEFWGDYYEGALCHIGQAHLGMGIYFSVWEYGIEYDNDIFYEIKEKCPINLNLPQEERIKALKDLISSIIISER